MNTPSFKPLARALLLTLLCSVAATPLWARTVNRPELREALKAPERSNAVATPDSAPPQRINEKRLSAQERAELRQQLRRNPATAGLKNAPPP